MPFGYNGRILHVNLSKHDISVEEPGDDFYRKYLGGSALNCYYLLKMIPVGADPLGSDNVLAISVGVTTGAAVAGQSRVDMSAKSPQTGLIGDSQAGGFFPAEMKWAGFDAFIFSGISPKPVYLWVFDGKYELRDATHIWGKTTGETEDLIREELGDKRIEIASIGQAGENLVKFAAIMNMCNRANGRCGMGAVMGSKKLKAVAVRGIQGKRNFKIAYPNEFKNLAREGASRLKGSPQESMARYGTPNSMIPQDAVGGLPTNNFISGTFKGVQNLSGEKLFNEFLYGWQEGKQFAMGRDSCYACPIRCKRVVELSDKYVVDKRYGGPEYETIAMFGSNCGIDDLKTVSKANELCNKYGLDTISCGGTISWAMECFERGILTKNDTDGIELMFGNEKALLDTIELITFRIGIGNLLAEGSANAAVALGNGSDEYLLTANKKEFPAHMPRVKVGLGIHYAVNPYGADHCSVAHDPGYELRPDGTNPATGAQAKTFKILNLLSPTAPRSLNEEKMRFVRITENFTSMLDSLCWCSIASGNYGGLFSPDELAMIVNYVTGWDVSVEELLIIGERKYNMMRVFNAREGHSKGDDRLPKRVYTPLQGGKSDGLKMDELEVSNAINEYYRQRGSDEVTGNPTKEKLKELGLEWAIF